MFQRFSKNWIKLGDFWLLFCCWWCYCLFLFYLKINRSSEGCRPCLWQGIGTRWSLGSLPTHAIPRYDSMIWKSQKHDSSLCTSPQVLHITKLKWPRLNTATAVKQSNSNQSEAKHPFWQVLQTKEPQPRLQSLSPCFTKVHHSNRNWTNKSKKQTTSVNI